MKKIEIYLLKQILKSFFLIFFIFIGISWLLQTTRLLNLIVVNKIPIFRVFVLSINIIPNTAVSILPIIIFLSIIFTCFKLNRDKELIAIYVLGSNRSEVMKPFIIFSIITFFLSLLLSLYISPHSYETFKKDEFDLRTNLDIENLGLNNFYDFNNEIIINFEKEEDTFTNLFIFQTSPKNNIILANKSEMDLDKNRLYLKLYDGFKAEIKETSNEILVYDKYNFDLNLDNNEIYNNSDINTHNINKLFKDRNFYIINQRIVDSFLLLALIFIITNHLLINLKFDLLNLSLMIIISILIIFFDNILGNLSKNNNFVILLMYCNIFIPLFLIYRFNKS